MMRLRACQQRIPAGSIRSCVIVALSILACSDPSVTQPQIEPQFAPGGGGPPVKVTAADPPAGEQGTSVSVRVLGSNFEPGSVAEFTLQGVAGKVRSNSTTFVSDSELVADITIESDAELGFYDVEVITPRGKKGVGTELFEVLLPGDPGTGNIPLNVLMRDDASDAITSDGFGNYVEDVDGVNAHLDRQFMFGTIGATPRPPTPRLMCFDFGNQSIDWFGVPGPICGTAIWNTSNHDNDPGGMKALPVGSIMTVYSRFIFRDPLTDDQVWVQFGDYDDPDRTSPNRAIARRLDLFTWEIEASTQLARVLREVGRVKGTVQRDTLGFVAMPFKATLRAVQ